MHGEPSRHCREAPGLRDEGGVRGDLHQFRHRGHALSYACLQSEGHGIVMPVEEQGVQAGTAGPRLELRSVAATMLQDVVDTGIGLVFFLEAASRRCAHCRNARPLTEFSVMSSGRVFAARRGPPVLQPADEATGASVHSSGGLGCGRAFLPLLLR